MGTPLQGKRKHKPRPAWLRWLARHPNVCVLLVPVVCALVLAGARVRSERTNAQRANEPILDASLNLVAADVGPLHPDPGGSQSRLTPAATLQETVAEDPRSRSAEHRSARIIGVSGGAMLRAPTHARTDVQGIPVPVGNSNGASWPGRDASGEAKNDGALALAHDPSSPGRGRGWVLPTAKAPEAGLPTPSLTLSDYGLALPSVGPFAEPRAELVRRPASSTIAAGQVNEVVSAVRHFTGDVTNAGTVRIINSVVSYAGDYTVTGTYFSDPSTNTFGNLNIGPAGVLIGFTGDLFRYSGNFNNASTNWAGWNTVDAGLTAFGAGSHLLQLPGFNPGLSSSGYTNNFAWGIFTLASNNSLVLQDGNATPGAAMFVRDLVLATGTNQLPSITGNGNSIYYDPTGASNTYLFNQTYPLAGGGIIAPVLRSFWTNSSNFYVGYDRSSNTFLITNGTGVKASNAYVGYFPTSSNNFLALTNGVLIVTNAAGTGTLDVRRGTLRIDGGTNDADIVLATNGVQSVLQFLGGVLRTRQFTHNTGGEFAVGDGISFGDLILEGSAGHLFQGGLNIRSNATVRMNGGLVQSPGGITLRMGGTLLWGMNHALAGGAPVHLDGGTLHLNGYQQSAALGALTLTANSTIHFGTGGTQALTFGSLAAHDPGDVLFIAAWQGTPWIGGGTDQVIFTGGTGVTAGFLAGVQFNGYPLGAILLGTGEIVPVPEPATWVTLAALGGWLAWHARSRRRQPPAG